MALEAERGGSLFLLNRVGLAFRCAPSQPLIAGDRWGVPWESGIDGEAELLALFLGFWVYFLLGVTDTFMAIEELAKLIPTNIHGCSGKVFYSGRLAFSQPSTLYMLGLNPGGCPV